MDTMIFDNQDFTNDINCHLKRTLTYLNRLKIDNNTNELLVRSLDYLINKIDTTLNLVSIDPRFDWKHIQDIIDKQFAKDNNLTGFTIYFDFKESEIKNRSIIQINHFNNLNDDSNEIS